MDSLPLPGGRQVLQAGHVRGKDEEGGAASYFRRNDMLGWEVTQRPPTRGYEDPYGRA